MGVRIQQNHLWRYIYQLMRTIQILLRRLPKSSLNHQILDEMGKLSRFIEDLSFQLENSVSHRQAYILRLCWQATRDVDFWVITLRDINPNEETEILNLHELTRSVRAQLHELSRHRNSIPA